MRAALISLLILLSSPLQALCSGPGIADRLSAADHRTIVQAVARTPYASGLFHTAQKDGRRIDVIGTLHVYDPRLVPLATRAAPLIAASTLLLVEAGLAERAALQNAMATDPDLLFLPDGPTLPERLPEADWQALAQAVSARGIPAVLASKMQPWYLGLMLAIPPCAMDDLSAGQEGLDAMLTEQARAAGIPVQALEPWDTLFSLMRSDPIDTQISQLRMAITPPALQQAMFATMLDSYFAGEIAELWQVSRAALKLIPGIDVPQATALFDASEADLLTGRNNAWVPHIAQAAQRHDRVTVAVGAAHLQGETGILNLLAQRGWTITPLD